MLTLERPLCLIFSNFPHLGKYQLWRFSEEAFFLIGQCLGSRLAEANPIKIGAKMIFKGKSEVFKALQVSLESIFSYIYNRELFCWLNTYKCLLVISDAFA